MNQLVQTAQKVKRILTDAEYKALVNLYNECNEDFWDLSPETHTAFFDRLFATSKVMELRK